MTTPMKPWNKERRYKTDWQKRIRNYRKGGTQLVKDVAILKGLINTEFKFSDSAYASIHLVASTPQYFLFNGLSRGTDAINRIGRTIRVKSIQFQSTFKLVGTINQASCRCAIVAVRDANGTAPSYSGTSNSIWLTNTMDSMRYLGNRKNIIVLRDMRINLDIDGISERSIKYYRKVNFETVYNAGNNGDVTDIQTWAIFAVFYANAGTGSDCIEVTGSGRIRYLDN